MSTLDQRYGSKKTKTALFRTIKFLCPMFGSGDTTNISGIETLLLLLLLRFDVDIRGRTKVLFHKYF